MGWLILIALLRLHIATQNAWLCAGIYSSYGLLMGVLSGAGFGAVALGSALAFGLSLGYFLLLQRLEGALWWAAAIGLPVAVLALRFALHAQGG